MKKLLLAALTVGALSVVSGEALAQGALSQNSHPMAFSFNVGPRIGLSGSGVTARINPEFQLHFGSRYEGPMVGLGLAIQPGFGGVGLSFAPRFQWDIQIVPGTAFFLSPYGGMDVGVVLYGNGAGFLMDPNFGLDLKFVVVNRLLLGFRPIGIGVPILIANNGTFVGVTYDIAFSIGATF
ncbi:MAG: hypothetical protein Q8Q09_00945 [Deltaproteobacteria bacterium]|nr:hypothetical protein [Deltaproteobacteria bacterium]